MKGGIRREAYVPRALASLQRDTAWGWARPACSNLFPFMLESDYVSPNTHILDAPSVSWSRGESTPGCPPGWWSCDGAREGFPTGGEVTETVVRAIARVGAETNNSPLSLKGERSAVCCSALSLTRADRGGQPSTCLCLPHRTRCVNGTHCQFTPAPHG